MIIILSGLPGDGKTWQALNGFDEVVKVLDLENRVEEKRARLYSHRMIEVIECKEIYLKADKSKGIKKYDTDYLSSYYTLIKEVGNLINDPDKLGTIVIDGITDIRTKYAKSHWFELHPKRINPRAEEWGDINADVAKNVIEPLINMCRHENINLVMTAQMKNHYIAGFQESGGKMLKVSIKDGKEEAFEDWQAYDVDTIINLRHPVKKNKPVLSQYMAHCSKSPVGAWEEDITGICLYDLLLELGL